MTNLNKCSLCFLLIWCGFLPLRLAAQEVARNPIMYADVPDVSMIRVGNCYYMSSTTMHLSPGVPIMKSGDLVNWKIIGYAYDTLANIDDLKLANGKNAYGRGSWASSLRYHDGTYYVSTFSQTTGKTYIFSTTDIAARQWKRSSFAPSYHDNSLFFDDDGRVYMVYGGGEIRLLELNDDLSGLKRGTSERVIIENATAPSGPNVMLPAEGSQLFKVEGKYYLFNISWPQGGMRTVIIHRAEQLTGPWEGRVVLQDKGVAQGGLISTPEGAWYAYLFRDYGAVGRIPYLVPVRWEDGWPVLGVDGKVPETLDLPASKGLMPGIVASDEFERTVGEPPLPLAWQWNHNPDNDLWSVTERPGYLRLTTGRLDTTILQARNTLTQRTFGPKSSAETAIDISHMKDGDAAGLALLQRKYGWVGVVSENGVKSIVMVSGESERPVEKMRVPLRQPMVYFKAVGDFKDRVDTGYFYYSLDGKQWIAIGSPIKMEYTLPHFMGYRYGVFNYATKATGGFVDVDYVRFSDGM
ncbi:Beta-xylosidase [Parapedobacter luteus]|uniref:Beta-xylosidase n=1 Tax=Parapedobacter luteus TaxID=623280 RepID=A0A1T5BEI3_9SPHI|nr:glycoside hydrolase 43 family protein [Parapedobacter luteus]SKB45712.1 Beta-xylosidase [Parapedobacter luteus]